MYPKSTFVFLGQIPIKKNKKYKITIYETHTVLKQVLFHRVFEFFLFFRILFISHAIEPIRKKSIPFNFKN